MTSSSQKTFDESSDDTFDDFFDKKIDEKYDQFFDQAFQNLTIRGAPKKRKPRVYIERNREEWHIRLRNDYFSDTPTYPDNLFQ